MLRQVAPGILVSEGIKVTIPHPDPCWVIESPDKTQVYGQDGQIFIFSQEEHLQIFTKAADLAEYVAVSYTWDALVDRHGALNTRAIVDHTGNPGFYAVVPLEKGI